MKFSAKLFETDWERSKDTKYCYEISGAFYDVFSNGDGKFHMAIEDKESLIERIRFYELYFSKEPYPIYSKQEELNKKDDIFNNVLFQVLGLPEEVVTTVNKKTGQKEILSPYEILDRISFEEHLYRGYGSLGKGPINESYLFTSEYPVIGCINYLISQGLFLQNIERVIYPAVDEVNFFPIRIDFDRFHEQKPKATQLFMDFCSRPLYYTKTKYIKTFGQLDKMSMQEWLSIAFDKSLSHKKSAEDYEMCLTLRHYFFAIAKKYISAFFKKYYQIDNVVSDTVLLHDTGDEYLYFRYLYFGLNFNMYGIDYRHFCKENNQVKCKYYPSRYVFSAKVKSKLRLAYQTVKAFFFKNPDYSFLPFLFLKLMGLPYPAFEIAKYFDFEHGTFEQFASLFEFISSKGSYEDFGYRLPVCDSNGNLVLIDHREAFDCYYYKNLPHIYMSIPFDINERSCGDFLFASEDQTITGKGFITGVSKLYSPLIVKFIARLSTEVERNHFIEFIRVHFVENEGCYSYLKSLFDLMREGYSFYGAFVKLDDNPIIRPELFRSFLFYCLAAMSEKKEYQFFIKMDKINAARNKDVRLDEFVNPYLSSSKVVIGSNLYCYEDKNHRFFVDKSILEIINFLDQLTLYFHDKRGPVSLVSPYSLLVENGVVNENKVQQLIRYGLPEKIRYSSILYISEDKPLCEREEFTELFEKDSFFIPIYTLYLYSKNGIFMVSKDEVERPVFIPSRVPKELYQRFSLCYLYEYVSKKKEKVCWNTFSKLSELIRTQKHLSTILHYVEQNNLQTEEKLIYDYYNFAISNYIKEIKRDSLTFFDCYQHIDNYGEAFYVMPGRCFNAYSKEQDSSTFVFLNKDKEAMVFSLNCVLFEYRLKEKKKLSALLDCVYAAGFPSHFIPEVKKILETEQEITLSVLESYFSFTDKEYLESSLPYVRDVFKLEYPSFTKIYDSMQIRNRLLHEGVYLSSYSNLFNSNMFHLEEMKQNPNYLKEFVSPLKIQLAEIMKGDAFVYLSPNVVFFESLVEEFSSFLLEQGVRTNTVFALKELLFCGYNNDSYFVTKTIRILFSYINRNEVLAYIKGIEKGVPLKVLTCGNSLTHIRYLFVLFFLFIIKSLIEVEAKRILLEQ